MNVADLTCSQHSLGRLIRIHDADFSDDVLESSGKRAYRVSRAHLAVEDAYQQYDTLVDIVPGVDQEQAKG